MPVHIVQDHSDRYLLHRAARSAAVLTGGALVLVGLAGLVLLRGRRRVVLFLRRW